MEYSIQEVARAAGTTSRTLRHYDSVGLVPPSRIGVNGYRYYDDLALVRLQRVLLLRELGLGLDAIGDVLRAQDAQTMGRADGAGEAGILTAHLELLRRERERVDRQIGAVERTIAALTASEVETELTQMQSHTERTGLMSENMFDGFDHTHYKEEVEERWGKNAYARSDAWWRELGAAGQQEWQQRVAELNADWIAAHDRGIAADSPEEQALAARHAAWLRSVPGTPTGDQFAGYLTGLGEMYVADERFAANYGGQEGAALVRDALRVFLDRE